MGSKNRISIEMKLGITIFLSILSSCFFMGLHLKLFTATSLVRALLVSIFFTIVILIIFRKKFLKPLEDITNALEFSEGSISTEILQKYNLRNNEIGDLAKSLTEMENRLKRYADTVNHIIEGKNAPIIKPDCNRDFLMAGLYKIINNNKVMLDELDNIVKAMTKGDFKERANENEFKGNWRKIIQKFNHVMDEIHRPVDIAREYLKNVANGENDTVKIVLSEYEGDIKDLMKNIIAVANSMDNIFDEIVDLSKEAINGNLSYRANTSKHLGAYSRMIGGINETIDAIIKPIQEASLVLQQFAKGNLSQRIEGDYQGDHVKIKLAVNSMSQKIQVYISDISDVLSEIANKNFDIGIERDYLGDFSELKDSINHIIGQLSHVLEEMNTTSDQVELAVNQVAASSQSLSQGATEQASSIEEINATIIQVAEQTNQNAEKADMANELSIKAKADALKGNEQMTVMLAAMNEIKESSQNISKIIKVIDDIAFQTNILALNAAVEAARAGEQGKSFAVVAQEVRDLAARSAEAARETTEIIDRSITKVEDGYTIANQTTEALSKIVDGISDTEDIVRLITISSSEQAKAIREIGQAIEQISHITQSNTATAEENAASSAEMAEQTHQLRGMMSEFKLKNAFKKEIGSI